MADAQELTTVGQYSSTIEAHVFRQLFDSEGIYALVVDHTAAGLLSIGHVQLRVRQSDLERAKAILDRDEEPEPAADDWVCGRCDETVDGGFEVCWSCGASIDERRDPSPDLPVAEEDEPPPTDSFAPNRAIESPDEPTWRCGGCGTPVGQSAAKCPHCGATRSGQTNPFHPPGVDDDPAEVATPKPLVDVDEAHAQLTTAFHAAIVGYLLCTPVALPPLLHLYSLWKLFTLDAELSDLAAGQRRRYAFALALDAAAICIFIIAGLPTFLRFAGYWR